MSKAGGKPILFEKVKLWTNSRAVSGELEREVTRRTILKREAESLKKDKKGESWSRIIVQGMRRRLEERESDMDIGLLEEQLGSPRRAGLLFVEAGKAEAIYYLHAWGQFWDELSGRHLAAKGGREGSGGRIGGDSQAQAV